jgi:tripartite-type tricarboxylate transporter receptor subunit TctC
MSKSITEGRITAMSRIFSAALATGLTLLLPVLPAAAQAPFYEGKTVTIVVSYAPGGGYDIYSRLLSRHLGAQVPGKPTVVVQNMPGAAGVVASNHVYNVAPKDGTVIAAVDQNMPMFQMLGGAGVRFDAARFNWLGVIASSNGLVMAWHTSGIKSLEDAKKRAVQMGATGTNDDAWVYAKVLNATTGTKFNLVRGYQGTAAVNVAIERGEVEAMGRSSYYGFLGQKPDWVRDGKVVILAQLGFAKQPELANVPLVLDLMKTEENRRMAILISLPTAIGYSHWMAPEVPADRVKTLREAYARTMKDAAFVAEATKLNLQVRPKSAAEVEALIKRAADTPEAVRKHTAATLEWK